MSNHAKWRAYSTEELQKIVNECYSLREVAAKLGYKKDGGGTIKSIHNMIEERHLNTDHFKGQGWNKEDYDLFAFDVDTYKKNGVSLLTSVLNIKNLERKCENCGNSLWMGSLIPLQVHHINGNHSDNRLENLQVLCPNCHALTNTWCKPKKVLKK